MPRGQVVRRKTVTFADDRSRSSNGQVGVVSMKKYKNLKRKLEESLELNRALTKIVIRASESHQNLKRRRSSLTDNDTSSGDDSSSTSSSDTDTDDDAVEETVVAKKVQVSRPLSSATRSVQPQQKPAPPKLLTVKTPSIERPKKVVAIKAPTLKVQPVDKDEDGMIILPQQIGITILLNLGTIKTDPDTFHATQYIYPVGYTVQRVFDSMIDKNKTALYTMSILDGGDEPLFEVAADDQPGKKFTSRGSPSIVWNQIAEKASEIRNRHFSPYKIIGHNYYGLRNGTIIHLTQELPGANLLRNYKWNEFEKVTRVFAKRSVFYGRVNQAKKRLGRGRPLTSSANDNNENNQAEGEEEINTQLGKSRTVYSTRKAIPTIICYDSDDDYTASSNQNGSEADVDFRGRLPYHN